MGLMNSITEFWTWFADHRAQLSDGKSVEPLIPELEEKLFAICRVDWEIGPGRKAPHLFALSPRGSCETLDITRLIIDQAPSIDGWEFSPAKPPRFWQLVFELKVDDDEITIDGKTWEFVIYRFKDGTYDLLFKPGDGNDLPEEYKRWAATIIADGEIGEEKRMRLVGTIEVVENWDEKTARSARKLESGLLGSVIC